MKIRSRIKNVAVITIVAVGAVCIIWFSFFYPYTPVLTISMVVMGIVDVILGAAIGATSY